MIHLPYDSAISCLGIYSREMKAHIHKKTYMTIYSQSWKQLKYPSAGERLDNCGISIQWNNTPQWKGQTADSNNKQTNLKCSFSNGNKPEPKYYILYGYTYRLFWKRENQPMTKQISGCQKLGRGERLTTKRQHEGIWRDDETDLYYNCGSDYMTIFLSKFIQQKE